MALLFSACNITKDLPEGRFLVDQNKVVLENRRQFPDRVSLEDQLSALVKQKPNRRAFFYARHRAWVYARRNCATGAPRIKKAGFLAKKICKAPDQPASKKGKIQRWACRRAVPRAKKATKFNKWLCEKYGEPLSIFNDSLTRRSEAAMKNYMAERGFFRCQVEHDTRLKGKKARTTYSVRAGERFVIDSFSLVCADPAIKKLLDETDGQRILRAGQPLDVQLFDAEKTRIARLLRNSGYADFTAQFIKSTGDSTGTKTAVTMRIEPKRDGSDHQTWRFGRVEVFSDFKKKVVLDTVLGENVRFISSDTAFSVRPSVILEAIKIEAGDLFCEDSVSLTNQKLVALGVFRFVNIRTEPDTGRAGELRTRIFLQKNKRMAVGFDPSFTFANGASVGGATANLFGLVAPAYIRARNLLRGGEQLSLTGQYGVEFNFSKDQNFIFSQDARGQLDFSAPRFIDYLFFWRTARLFGLAPRAFYAKLKNAGRPRGALGYEFRDIFDYFRIQSLAGSYGYDLRASLENRYQWQHFGADLLVSRFYPKFDSATATQIRLRNSLGSRLITGFVLKEFSWQHTPLPARKGHRWGHRLTAELSGGEVYLANRLSNSLTSKNGGWAPSGVPFSQFLLLDGELSWSKQFDRSVGGAARIVAGGIRSYGFSSSAPYLRQFFVGGPNSLRGWQILELGPGSYYDPSVTSRFYQKGDLRLEASAELRFPIWWAYRGAFFMDAGNQWLWREDPDRPGSGFGRDFLSEIALNAGLGVRLDLDYFLIRLDFGLPLRNPYATADNPNRWIYQRFSEFGIRDFRPNLAIGLPF